MISLFIAGLKTLSVRERQPRHAGPCRKGPVPNNHPLPSQEYSAVTKTPVRVAVTGAAGQIGYALLFRIASGEMLGSDGKWVTMGVCSDGSYGIP